MSIYIHQLEASDLRENLDAANLDFTSSVMHVFQNLSNFDHDKLRWLNAEHYQFSNRNPKFLSDACKKTKTLDCVSVSSALDDNFNEEKDHARWYKNALLELDINVDQRKPFEPTETFFKELDGIIQTSASHTLGAMYATETAAIFEHNLFLSISGHLWQGSREEYINSTIKRFHDLHLEGVEQAHQDELGVFISKQYMQKDVNPDQFIDQDSVADGAMHAIHLMKDWWGSLISYVR